MLRHLALHDPDNPEYQEALVNGNMSTGEEEEEAEQGEVGEPEGEDRGEEVNGAGEYEEGGEADGDEIGGGQNEMYNQQYVQVGNHEPMQVCVVYNHVIYRCRVFKIPEQCSLY